MNPRVLPHLAGRKSGGKHCRQDAGSASAAQSHSFELHHPNARHQNRGAFLDPVNKASDLAPWRHFKCIE